ncbi:MAG: AhpC/TSA family protein [Bacteroidales bacterium]|nr:AhpC/TSA family protein [Bacteroidales bacterium]
MMKNVFWLILVSLFISACSGPANQYAISGKVDGATAGRVVLSKVVDNDLVAVDSVETTDGTVAFTGTIEMPEIYYLEFKEDDQFHRFFIEPGSIVVSGNIENPVFTGSEAQVIFDNYNLSVQQFDEKRETLYAEFMEAQKIADTARTELIRQEAQLIDDNQSSFMKEFVNAQSDNVVGPYIVVNNIYQFDLEDLVKARSNYGEEIAGSKYVQILDKQIGKMQKVAIGQPAPIFAQNDTTGNPVSLDSFKGKYVLIDFWASWCRPCRQENPNVVVAYQKFHDKGFDVLGVSLDKQKGAWIQAIADDNLTWTHVSDLKYWSNEASNMYAVSSIPANFLLDPEGIIIAKDLRGEELQQKLEEIFN